MEKENFRLFEDKIEQEIGYFASFDAPLSIGLVFDASGSMGSKLTKARQAAAQFFKTANPKTSSSWSSLTTVHNSSPRSPETPRRFKTGSPSPSPRAGPLCSTASTWR